MNEVWLNDGRGHFTAGTPFDDRSSVGIALGDLDGDGDLDAFVTNWGTGDRVWRNNGKGVFANSWQNPSNDFGSEVALGDLDGDGDLDAVVANNIALSIAWRNNGAGSFTQLATLSHTNFGVALGDFDSDGDLDVYLNGSAANQVWFNDGRGNFSDSGLRLGKSPEYSAEIGDIDGDGDLDLIDAVNDAGASVIWFNRAPFSIYLPLALRNAGKN